MYGLPVTSQLPEEEMATHPRMSLVSGSSILIADPLYASQ